MAKMARNRKKMSLRWQKWPKVRKIGITWRGNLGNGQKIAKNAPEVAKRKKEWPKDNCTTNYNSDIGKNNHNRMLFVNLSALFYICNNIH